MDLLAYWTKDREQLKRLFLLSALGQNIGRKKHHEGDYLNRTINKALSIVTVGYNPKAYAAQKRAEELDREKRNPPVSGGTAKPEPVETGVPFLEMVRRFNGNDSENADRLAAYCAGKFLYCVDLKTWLMFDGKKWKPVALTELIKPARAAITHTLAILARGYATFTGGGGVLADETMKRYNDMLRYLTKTANNEKNLFSSIRLAAGDDSMKCYATDFDRDPYLLNCDNGVLNLRTGELIPHNPEQRFMKCARAAYDRKAHSTLWADTVRQIVPDADTRDYVQRLAGYCMSGDVGAEKIFFLHGTGGNGKGVFIETLGHALGDYAAPIPVEILLSSKYGRDGNNATPEKAKLKGVRLAKSSESSIDSYFDDGALKLLTGGDEITARPLHSNPITFSPSHKLVVSTNHMPAIKDVSDEGIKRRLVIIPFHAHFAEPDRHLKSKLMEPDHMADCLLWAYEGFKRYQEKGVDDNTFSQEIRDSNRTYYMNNDFIGEFFDGSCNVGPMYSVSTQRLYKSYQSFADDSGSPKLKRRQFTELIKKRLNVTPVKSHGGRYLKGVGLKDVADY